jgi:hypothetical protein
MESMYTQQIAVEKECIACKVVSGAFFVGFGAFHLDRTVRVWNAYGSKEKLFNVFATSFLFGIAFLNFYAGYEIYQGKRMATVELRPSYTQRFKNAYDIM